MSRSNPSPGRPRRDRLAHNRCPLGYPCAGDGRLRVEVALTIRNEGWLPIPWVLFEDVLPGFALAQRPPRLKVKGRRIQIKMLRGGQEIEIRYKVDCVMRGFYPIGPLRVAFDVPAGKKVARVEALRAGAVLPFRQEGRTVRFEVPTVADYEVVALT